MAGKAADRREQADPRGRRSRLQRERSPARSPEFHQTRTHVVVKWHRSLEAVPGAFPRHFAQELSRRPRSLWRCWLMAAARVRARLRFFVLATRMNESVQIVLGVPSKGNAPYFLNLGSINLGKFPLLGRLLAEIVHRTPFPQCPFAMFAPLRGTHWAPFQPWERLPFLPSLPFQPRALSSGRRTPK